MLPFLSLDAATAPGQGAIKDLEGESFSQYLVQVQVSGSPTLAEVKFHASLDGITWFTPGLTMNDGTEYQLIKTSPWRFVAANLNSLTGGSNPSVTAWIAVAP